MPASIPKQELKWIYSLKNFMPNKTENPCGTKKTKKIVQKIKLKLGNINERSCKIYIKQKKLLNPSKQNNLTLQSHN